MFYVERLGDSSIKKLSVWPIPGIKKERLGADHADVVSYKDKAETVSPPVEMSDEEYKKQMERQGVTPEKLIAFLNSGSAGNVIR